MVETKGGEDQYGTVFRFLRETDHPGVFTCVREDEVTLVWLRFDKVRKGWVLSGCPKDGEPVPSYRD